MCEGAGDAVAEAGRLTVGERWTESPCSGRAFREKGGQKSGAWVEKGGQKARDWVEKGGQKACARVEKGGQKSGAWVEKGGQKARDWGEHLGRKVDRKLCLG